MPRQAADWDFEVAASPTVAMHELAIKLLKPSGADNLNELDAHYPTPEKAPATIARDMAELDLAREIGWASGAGPRSVH